MENTIGSHLFQDLSHPRSALNCPEHRKFFCFCVRSSLRIIRSGLKMIEQNLYLEYKKKKPLLQESMVYEKKHWNTFSSKIRSTDTRVHWNPAEPAGINEEVGLKHKFDKNTFLSTSMFCCELWIKELASSKRSFFVYRSSYPRETQHYCRLETLDIKKIYQSRSVSSKQCFNTCNVSNEYAN